MKTRNTIIVKKLLKSVVLLMTVTMLLSILGMMIDGIIIGRFLGADRTAAYGLVAPVLIVAALFGGLLSSGTVTQLSQYKAKGEIDSFNRTFSMVLLEGMVLSFVIISITWIFRNSLTEFFGAVKDKAYLQEYMIQYIKGLLPAVPFLLLNELVNQVIQLDGNKKIPMIGVFTMLITDVVLDLLNVYVFKLDMYGMALATTISYYTTGVILLFHFFSSKCNVHVTLKKLPWADAWKLLSKGLPNATSRLMTALRTLCLNKILVVVASSAAVAAFSVNNSAGNILTAVGNGVAASCVMIAGVFLADRDQESLTQLLSQALKYAIALSACIAVVFFVFSYQITGMFISGNEEAMNEASILIKYYALYVPLFAVNSVLYSYLQGLQNVKYANIICALGNGGLVVVLAFILGNALGARGVWLAFPISGVLSLIMIYIVAWVYQGHMPKSFVDIAFLPHTDIDKENMIEQSITEETQIIDFSEMVRAFCLERSGNTKKSNMCALCIEEMLKNTFVHGRNRTANTCVDTRVIYENDLFVVRFRDNGNSFNPKDYFKNDKCEDLTMHIGIRMVFSTAVDVKYTNVLQLNNLTVTY